MGQRTLDYGIDLGTTNSVICRLTGVEPVVVKNNVGWDFTPSVVQIDKKDRLIVGRAARDKQVIDPDNVAYEFKRRMGEDWAFKFQRSGREMRPEELSAEVLKELRSSATQRTGDSIPGAVITTPAAFELPQCEATKQAAVLAGFRHYPLLQEPVAAALAYGANADSDKVYWLVYDLGGGTFDAALINMRDGMFNVVNHLGDNDLGGQLIDWDIVMKLLVPALTTEYSLTGFDRDNKKWLQAFAKLKLHAEEAKINLSGSQTSSDIEIPFLCTDDRGDPVEFNYELQRADVERLAEPLIRRTITKCRLTLEEKRLGPGNIEKLLLVGGATLMPYLRERLSDPNEGLGVPLAHERDPLTVVAWGAAIFAGSQLVDEGADTPLEGGGLEIDLKYKPVDADPEPLVGGRVDGAGESLDGYTVQFVNSSVKPQWRSGQVAVAANGAFQAQLYAEKGVENVFEIELRNAQGELVKTKPDRFSYRVIVSAIEAPLAHSVGVGLRDNKMKWLAKKGEPLPLRKHHVFKTAVDLKKGRKGEMLRIPLMEGESPRADRNTMIGELEIEVDRDLVRDIPVGSDVEITVIIDESRLVTMKAYVPLLTDEEFEKVFDYDKYRARVLDPDVLREAFEREQARLDELRVQVDETNSAAARNAMSRIADNHMVEDVTDVLAAARGGSDAAMPCETRIRELQMALDRVEDELELPLLIAAAEAEIEQERGIVNSDDCNPTREEIMTFERLEKEMRQAIKDKNEDLIRKKMNELDQLGINIVIREPGWWVAHFLHLNEKRQMLSDQDTAELCFSQGNRALMNDDVEGLKMAVRQLWRLLPPGDPDRLKFDSSSITE